MQVEKKPNQLIILTNLQIEILLSVVYKFNWLQTNSSWHQSVLTRI